MGFFSWTCAKSKKPILAGVHNDWYSHEFSRVTAVYPNGDRISGRYDGYGRIETASGSEIDVAESMDMGKAPKLVLTHFYDNEKWSDLSKNESDRGQGYFYGNDEMEEMFGLPPEGEWRDRWTALREREARFTALGKSEAEKVIAALPKNVRSNCSLNCMKSEYKSINMAIMNALIFIGYKIQITPDLVNAVDGNFLGRYATRLAEDEMLLPLAENAAPESPELSSIGFEYEAPRCVRSVIGAATQMIMESNK